VPAERLTVHGVKNVARITPRLYRGAQPEHEGYDALAKMGIDIVVGVRGTKRDSEGREVEQAGMKYFSFPWHCPFPNDKVFAGFLKLIKDNPDKKIFVHCRLGDDRGGMMIASYRMAVEGWSAKEAGDEMKDFGFVWWHHLICPGLGRYESHFPEHLRKNEIFDSLGPWKEREKPTK
jgi:protein tyrosine/serine phosphatase